MNDRMKYVRPTVPSDATYIGWNMRKSDIAELKAEGLLCTPCTAVLESMEASAEAYTALDTRYRATPIAMFGVGSRYSNILRCTPVWFLATNGLYRAHNVIPFLRCSRLWMDYFVSKYGDIGNEVHDKNMASLQWLEWCGFEVVSSHRNLFTNELFHTMVRYAKNNNKKRKE